MSEYDLDTPEFYPIFLIIEKSMLPPDMGAEMLSYLSTPGSGVNMEGDILVVTREQVDDYSSRDKRKRGTTTDSKAKTTTTASKNDAKKRLSSPGSTSYKLEDDNVDDVLITITDDMLDRFKDLVPRLIEEKTVELTDRRKHLLQELEEGFVPSANSRDDKKKRTSQLPAKGLKAGSPTSPLSRPQSRTPTATAAKDLSQQALGALSQSAAARKAAALGLSTEDGSPMRIPIFVVLDDIIRKAGDAQRIAGAGFLLSLILVPRLSDSDGSPLYFTADRGLLTASDLVEFGNGYAGAGAAAASTASTDNLMSDGDGVFGAYGGEYGGIVAAHTATPGVAMASMTFGAAAAAIYHLPPSDTRGLEQNMFPRLPGELAVLVSVDMRFKHLACRFLRVPQPNSLLTTKQKSAAAPIAEGKSSRRDKRATASAPADPDAIATASPNANTSNSATASTSTSASAAAGKAPAEDLSLPDLATVLAVAAGEARHALRSFALDRYAYDAWTFGVPVTDLPKPPYGGKVGGDSANAYTGPANGNGTGSGNATGVGSGVGEDVSASSSTPAAAVHASNARKHADNRLYNLLLDSVPQELLDINTVIFAMCQQAADTCTHTQISLTSLPPVPPAAPAAATSARGSGGVGAGAHGNSGPMKNQSLGFSPHVPLVPPVNSTPHATAASAAHFDFALPSGPDVLRSEVDTVAQLQQATAAGTLVDYMSSTLTRLLKGTAAQLERADAPVEVAQDARPRGSGVEAAVSDVIIAREGERLISGAAAYCARTGTTLQQLLSAPDSALAPYAAVMRAAKAVSVPMPGVGGAGLPAYAGGGSSSSGERGCGALGAVERAIAISVLHNVRNRGLCEHALEKSTSTRSRSRAGKHTGDARSAGVVDFESMEDEALCHELGCVDPQRVERAVLSLAFEHMLAYPGPSFHVTRASPSLAPVVMSLPITYYNNVLYNASNTGNNVHSALGYHSLLLAQLNAVTTPLAQICHLSPTSSSLLRSAAAEDTHYNADSDLSAANYAHFRAYYRDSSSAAPVQATPSVTGNPVADAILSKMRLSEGSVPEVARLLSDPAVQATVEERLVLVLRRHNQNNGAGGSGGDGAVVELNTDHGRKIRHARGASGVTGPRVGMEDTNASLYATANTPSPTRTYATRDGAGTRNRLVGNANTLNSSTSSVVVGVAGDVPVVDGTKPSGFGYLARSENGTIPAIAALFGTGSFGSGSRPHSSSSDHLANQTSDNTTTEVSAAPAMHLTNRLSWLHLPAAVHTRSLVMPLTPAQLTHIFQSLAASPCAHLHLTQTAYLPILDALLVSINTAVPASKEKYQRWSTFFCPNLNFSEWCAAPAFVRKNKPLETFRFTVPHTGRLEARSKLLYPANGFESYMGKNTALSGRCKWQSAWVQQDGDWFQLEDHALSVSPPSSAPAGDDAVLDGTVASDAAAGQTDGSGSGFAGYSDSAATRAMIIAGRDSRVVKLVRMFSAVMADTTRFFATYEDDTSLLTPPAKPCRGDTGSNNTHSHRYRAGVRNLKASATDDAQDCYELSAQAALPVRVTPHHAFEAGGYFNGGGMYVRHVLRAQESGDIVLPVPLPSVAAAPASTPAAASPGPSPLPSPASSSSALAPTPNTPTHASTLPLLQPFSLTTPFSVGFTEHTRCVYPDGHILLHGSYACASPLTPTLRVACSVTLYPDSAVLQPVLALSSALADIGVEHLLDLPELASSLPLPLSRTNTNANAATTADLDDVLAPTLPSPSSRADAPAPLLCLLYLYTDAKGLVWLRTAAHGDDIPITTAALAHLYHVGALQLLNVARASGFTGAAASTSPSSGGVAASSGSFSTGRNTSSRGYGSLNPRYIPNAAHATAITNTFAAAAVPAADPSRQASVATAIEPDPVSRVVTVTRADGTQLVLHPCGDSVAQFADGTRVYVDVGGAAGTGADTAAANITNTGFGGIGNDEDGSGSLSSVHPLTSPATYTHSLTVEHPALSPIVITRTSTSAAALLSPPLLAYAAPGVAVEMAVVLRDGSVLTRHANMGVTYRKRHGPMYVCAPAYTSSYESDLLFAGVSNRGLYGPIAPVDDDAGVDVYASHPAFAPSHVYGAARTQRQGAAGGFSGNDASIGVDGQFGTGASDTVSYAKEAAADPRMLLPRAIVVVPAYVLEQCDAQYRETGICGPVAHLGASITPFLRNNYQQKLGLLRDTCLGVNDVDSFSTSPSAPLSSTPSSSAAAAAAATLPHGVALTPHVRAEFASLLPRMFRAQVPLSTRQRPVHSYLFDCRTGTLHTRDASDDIFTCDLSEPAPAKPTKPLGFAAKTGLDLASLRGHAGAVGAVAGTGVAPTHCTCAASAATATTAANATMTSSTTTVASLPAAAAAPATSTSTLASARKQAARGKAGDQPPSRKPTDRAVCASCHLPLPPPAPAADATNSHGNANGAVSGSGVGSGGVDTDNMITNTEADEEALSFGANASLLEARHLTFKAHNHPSTASLPPLPSPSTTQADTRSRLIVLFRSHTADGKPTPLSSLRTAPASPTTPLPLSSPFTHGFTHAIELCSPHQPHVRNAWRRALADGKCTVLPVDTLVGARSSHLLRFMRAVTHAQGYQRTPHAPLHSLVLTPPRTTSLTAAGVVTSSSAAGKPAARGGLVRGSVMTELWQCPLLQGNQVLHAWRVLNSATAFTQTPTEMIEGGAAATASAAAVEGLSDEEEREKQEKADVEAELQWMLLQVKLAQRDTQPSALAASASAAAMSTSASTSSLGMRASTSTSSLPSSAYSAATATATATAPTTSAITATTGIHAATATPSLPSSALSHFASSDSEPQLLVSLSSLFARHPRLLPHVPRIAYELSGLPSLPPTTRARAVHLHSDFWRACLDDCGEDALSSLLSLLGLAREQDGEGAHAVEDSSSARWVQSVDDMSLATRVRCLVQSVDTAYTRINTTKRNNKPGFHASSSVTAKMSTSVRNNGEYSGYVDPTRDLVAEHVRLVAQQYSNGVDTTYGNTEVSTMHMHGSGKKRISAAVQARESRLRNMSHVPVVHEKWGKSFNKPLVAPHPTANNMSSSQALSPNRHAAQRTLHASANNSAPDLPVYEPLNRGQDGLTSKELKKLQALTQTPRYTSPLAPSQSPSPSSSTAARTLSGVDTHALAKTLQSGSSRGDTMATTMAAEALVLPPIARARK